MTKKKDSRTSLYVHITQRPQRALVAVKACSALALLGAAACDGDAERALLPPPERIAPSAPPSGDVLPLPTEAPDLSVAAQPPPVLAPPAPPPERSASPSGSASAPIAKPRVEYIQPQRRVMLGGAPPDPDPGRSLSERMRDDTSWDPLRD